LSVCALIENGTSCIEAERFVAVTTTSSITESSAVALDVRPSPKASTAAATDRPLPRRRDRAHRVHP
ncbi:MAG: hypothetical protein CMQ24_13620, partial [Gammaproteobacteria bacterium]|nr:hypothetical protein [Gammaproteobacteria bacterium]